jgi:hypothetical protein
VSLLSWFRGGGVSEQDVRSEVWRLGSRHMGAPLEGALQELQNPDLSVQQAELLRACVRKLRAG